MILRGSAAGEIAIRAIKYAVKPTSSVTVTPQNTATNTARTDEITENAPLIPQYQAVGATSSPYWAFLIPSGNAMPMKNPDGKSKAADTAILNGVDAATNCRVRAGLTRMNAASTIGSNQIHLLRRWENRLPRLEASSNTNKTTVNP